MYKDLEKKKAWFANNKERLKVYYKRDYEKNRAARIQKSSDWRKNNPDKYKEQYLKGNSVGAPHHYKYARSNKGRFYSLKLQAKKRNLEVTFGFDEYSLLVQSECHYCGKALNATGSGLDRKDNKYGYTASNVVPCCKNCNIMKNNFLTYNEMVVVSEALRRYRNGK